MYVNRFELLAFFDEDRSAHPHANVVGQSEMESAASGIVQSLREKSMPNSTRTSYNAEQKIAILRKHLLEHVAVSQLCDENRHDDSLCRVK